MKKIKGVVVKGNQLGSKIGFPTANVLLHSDEVSTFGCGVWAVSVYIDEKKYYGVANIGKHPTVGESVQTQIEVHIFDFDSNIYGKMLSIELLYHLRDEKKFENVTELKKAINSDLLLAKKLISK
ncbi:MAG: riboflavin kinase [Bacteroidetes bacterium]|nr:riboflavin kinase [Bacteroidota bacterium]